MHVGATFSDFPVLRFHWPRIFVLFFFTELQELQTDTRPFNNMVTYSTVVSNCLR